MIRLDRRTLLIGGGAGIGLVVAYALWPRESGSALTPRQGEHVLGHYVRVGTDGRVTIAVPQVETGQGAWTALPQIAADELGAAWEMVGVEPAPVAPLYANPVAESEGWFASLGTLRQWRLPDAAAYLTVRSSSVRGHEASMRQAGAAARALLIRSAAERWHVDPAECDAADGFVSHESKRLAFASLAERAAEMNLPEDAPLRRPGSGTLAGRPLPRLDLPAKSDGSFRFAGDVRLAEMLFAAVRIAPPGGRLTAFSRAAAERGGGTVVMTKDWLAVAAPTSWAAEQALRAADPKFEAPERDVGDLRALCEAVLDSGEAETVFSEGDYSTAVSGSRALAATYWVAPAAHLALEPVSATARFSGDKLEVWAGTQAPGFAKESARSAADGAEVTLYPMPAGDMGGRAVEADAIPIAVALAKRLGRPVQVTLSANHSQVQDRLAAPALARMAALPTADGRLSAWRMQLATADGLACSIGRLGKSDEAAGLGSTITAAARPPYAVPNVRIDAAAVPLPFAAGYMRGEPERALTFFTESFVDELARARGAEPLAFRMGMLGANPRLARCVSTAASLGGWDGGAQGSTMGIAACAAYGAFIGLLADASIGPDQRIAVHRLVAVVDCGRIANAGILRQQIESGLIWGVGQATVGTPALVAGVPKSRAIGGVGLPRIAGMPNIHVELIPSSANPGGVSGLGPAVIAPALANAIFAGSGRRLRSLPFDLAA